MTPLLPGDVICFSHLRWDFVFQRPQHFMSRWASRGRVYFVEEPRFGRSIPHLEISNRGAAIQVVVPHLTDGLAREDELSIQRDLIGELVRLEGLEDYLLWYYTPMALPFSRQLCARGVIYDCMDELSAFKGAPPALRLLEEELLERADAVLTGGYSLYEAKRTRHPRVYPFPSSVDFQHFASARLIREEPPDQRPIPRPRLGFFGVLDERFDTELVEAAAALRPNWSFVMVGPIVKVDPASLPCRPNVFYLSQKRYEELPRYIAGWDVALIPFARNEATRFISPTKTPEYLAAGRPVLSTSIRDVAEPYGRHGLVRIADEPEEFVSVAESLMIEAPGPRLAAADAFLAGMSWDKTWRRIESLVASIIADRDAGLRPSAECGG